MVGCGASEVKGLLSFAAPAKPGSRFVSFVRACVHEINRGIYVAGVESRSRGVLGEGCWAAPLGLRAAARTLQRRAQVAVAQRVEVAVARRHDGLL